MNYKKLKDKDSYVFNGDNKKVKKIFKKVCGKWPYLQVCGRHVAARPHVVVGVGLPLVEGALQLVRQPLRVLAALVLRHAEQHGRRVRRCKDRNEEVGQRTRGGSILQNRNCEPGLILKNQFFYYIKMANEPEL